MERDVYGIDTLLEITLHFIRKDNPFSEKYFEKLREHENSLKNSVLETTKRKKIEVDIKNIYKKLSEENSFFSNIKTIDSIIDNTH